MDVDVGPIVSPAMCCEWRPQTLHCCFARGAVPFLLGCHVHAMLVSSVLRSEPLPPVQLLYACMVNWHHPLWHMPVDSLV